MLDYNVRVSGYLLKKGEKMDYNAIQENSVLRAYSRNQLKGTWGKMAFTIFIYFLITIGSQFLFWEYGIIDIPILDWIITIGVFITAGPFTLGIAGYFLKRIRGEEICTENLFDGFSRFFQSFLLCFFLLSFYTFMVFAVNNSRNYKNLWIFNGILYNV